MISVLVRTHNRSVLLKKCLASLVKQSFKGEHEILVIDSASTDNTSLVVKEFSSSNPQIRYIYEPIAGAARARKKGLESAPGDILVWIDDDCTADKEWLENIVKVFSMDIQADIVGGQVIINWETKRPAWLPETLERALGKQKLADTLSPVNMVNGANIAYRAALAKKITFDMSALGPSGGSKKVMSEDAEFCRQARIQGAKIYFTPDAVVYHYVPRQHSTLKYLLGRYYVVGRSNAIRYQLMYPNDKIDCAKRITKGFLNLVVKSLAFILKLPVRLFSRPNYVLVDGALVIMSFSYLVEETRFFLRLLVRNQ